jgi:hypothetical protein
LAFLARRNSKHSQKGNGSGIHVQENDERYTSWSHLENQIFAQDEDIDGLDIKDLASSTARGLRLSSTALPSISFQDQSFYHTELAEPNDEVEAPLSSPSDQSRANLAPSQVRSTPGLTKEYLSNLPGRQNVPETSHADYEATLLDRVGQYLDNFPSETDQMIPPLPYSANELVNCMKWRMENKNLTSESNDLLLVTDSPETRYWAQRFEIPVRDPDELSRLIAIEYKDFRSRQTLYQKQHPEGQMLDPSESKSSARSVRENDRPRSSAGKGQNRHKRQSKSFDSQAESSYRSPSKALIQPAITQRPNSGKLLETPPKPLVPEVIDPDSFSRSNDPESKVTERFMVKATRNDGSWGRGRGRGRLWVPGKT